MSEFPNTSAPRIPEGMLSEHEFNHLKTIRLVNVERAAGLGIDEACRKHNTSNPTYYTKSKILGVKFVPSSDLSAGKTEGGSFSTRQPSIHDTQHGEDATPGATKEKKSEEWDGLYDQEVNQVDASEAEQPDPAPVEEEAPTVDELITELIVSASPAEGVNQVITKWIPHRDLLLESDNRAVVVAGQLLDEFMCEIQTALARTE